MGLDSSEIKILEKTNLFTHVFWTKEDIVCLIENWGKKNISEIAKMIGISPKAVSRKAARIRKKDNTLCSIKGDQNSYSPFVRGDQRLLTLMEKLQDSLNENTVLHKIIRPHQLWEKQCFLNPGL